MEDSQLFDPPPDPLSDSSSGSVQDAEEVTRAIEALRRQMMQDWWRVCLALWLTVGLISLWWLRSDFQELREYFTWAAVRATIVFKRVPSVGLIACFAVTFGLLLSESRQILFGLSEGERSRLLTQLNKINEQGPSHPQWKVIAPEADFRKDS
ncbi:MAG: hypothetical protein WA947_04010 [Phormidesmis sp.]